MILSQVKDIYGHKFYSECRFLKMLTFVLFIYPGVQNTFALFIYPVHNANAMKV